MKKIIIYLFVMLVVGMGGIINKAGAVKYDESVPELYIKAVNPGYKINGVNNVGEMIEIARKSSDESISLAGASVGYTNSKGNYSTLFNFPETSWMTGETLLLRLASSPEHELAADNYKTTIAATAGMITLEKDGEILDKVCWSGEGCYKAFTSTKPTTLVRNVESGVFEHKTDYEPVYDEKSYYVEEKKEEEGYGALTPSQCRGLEFSEILSYYESSKSEQFIELYNRGSEQILLDGCELRYKNKKYTLKGIVAPEGYFVVYPDREGFALTKNPTSSNTIELVDTDGVILDKLEYPNGQRKGTSYAFINYDATGKEVWRITYAPTPGSGNNYQEYKSCENGKVLNKETGNCVKVAELKTKVCKEGYYLNVLTGRCNKIKTEEEKKCKEGYYLNPETGRCRKIKENKSADYSIEPETYEEESSFVALYAILAVVGVAVLYLVYEYRHEIVKWITFVKAKLRRK